MFRPAELFIGLRYIHARRGKHRAGFVSVMAILATALGIAVLVTILSIMNGFEGELRGRILGMAAHLTVATDTLSAEDFARQLDDIRQLGAVRAAAPFLERDVLIQSNGVVRPVVVRGIDIKQEERVTELHSHIVDGKASMLESSSYGVLIGHELAQHLALTVGDKLTLLSPRPRATPAGLLPVMKRFTVAGIFEFGLSSTKPEPNCSPLPISMM